MIHLCHFIIILTLHLATSKLIFSRIIFCAKVKVTEIFVTFQDDKCCPKRYDQRDVSAAV